MSPQDRFLRDLPALVGDECWAIVGGEGTGSVISLSIGTRHRRDKPLRNPHLSELVRQYDSAYWLMIWCPWRIDSPKAIVSDSHMEHSKDGPMVSGFASICGQRIKAVHCAGPAFDRRLEFDNAHSLVVHFSNIDRDYDECYSFGNQVGNYTVNMGGELTYEDNE